MSERDTFHKEMEKIQDEVKQFYKNRIVIFVVLFHP